MYLSKNCEAIKVAKCRDMAVVVKTQETPSEHQNRGLSGCSSTPKWSHMVPPPGQSSRWFYDEPVRRSQAAVLCLPTYDSGLRFFSCQASGFAKFKDKFDFCDISRERFGGFEGRGQWTCYHAWLQPHGPESAPSMMQFVLVPNPIQHHSGAHYRVVVGKHFTFCVIVV